MGCYYYIDIYRFSQDLHSKCGIQFHASYFNH
nr:MAG TPA: hypothetical protein [Bacteriophage sp.]